jgi:hypothetical protein
MSLPELYAQAVMTPEWALVVITGSGILLSLVLNFVCVSYFVGRYQLKVEDLERDRAADSAKLAQHIEDYRAFRQKFGENYGPLNGHSGGNQWG